MTLERQVHGQLDGLSNDASVLNVISVYKFKDFSSSST